MSKSVPLWRKKHNPEDKDKVIATKVESTYQNRNEYLKYFKTAEVTLDSFKVESKEPSVSKPYVPEFLRNKSRELNPDLEMPVEEISKPITLTAKDFPALGKPKKSTSDSGPSPTQTPNNTPNTFSYLEAARKNADKPAPKPISAPKKRTIESYEEDRNDVEYTDDYVEDKYGKSPNHDWVDEIENDFYHGKW